MATATATATGTVTAGGDSGDTTMVTTATAMMRYKRWCQWRRQLRRLWQQQRPQCNNALLGAGVDDDADGNRAPQGLGCAFCIYFSARLEHIFRNPRDSADYFRFQEDMSELNHSKARLICSWIRRNPESGLWPKQKAGVDLIGFDKGRQA